MTMQSIKALTAQVRQERDKPVDQNSLQVEKATEIYKEESPPPIKDEPPKKDLSNRPTSNGADLEKVISAIREHKVMGSKKMLIRIDDKHSAILGHLKNALDIDVTQFINFLLDDFMERYPDIKTEIKNSLKNSLKDL